MHKTSAWYYETRDIVGMAKTLLNKHSTLGTNTHYSTCELIDCIGQSDISPLFVSKDDNNRLESRPFRWPVQDEMVNFSTGVTTEWKRTSLFITAIPQSTSGILFPISCDGTTIPQIIATFRELFEYLDKKEKEQLTLEDKIAQVFAGYGLTYNLKPNKKGFSLSVRMPYKTKLTVHLKRDFTEDEIAQALNKALNIKDVISGLGRVTLTGYGNHETWISPNK